MKNKAYAILPFNAIQKGYSYRIEFAYTYIFIYIYIYLKASFHKISLFANNPK